MKKINLIMLDPLSKTVQVPIVIPVLLLCCCITNLPTLSGMKPPPLYSAHGFSRSQPLTGHMGDDSSLVHDVWFLPFPQRYKGLVKRKNSLVRVTV